MYLRVCQKGDYSYSDKFSALKCVHIHTCYLLTRHLCFVCFQRVFVNTISMRICQFLVHLYTMWVHTHWKCADTDLRAKLCHCNRKSALSCDNTCIQVGVKVNGTLVSPPHLRSDWQRAADDSWWSAKHRWPSWPVVFKKSYYISYLKLCSQSMR